MQLIPPVFIILLVSVASLIMSVCNTITFESFDVKVHVCGYIFREYGWSSYVKVIVSRSRSQQKKTRNSLLPQYKNSIGNNSGSIEAVKFACSVGLSVMVNWMAWPSSCHLTGNIRICEWQGDLITSLRLAVKTDDNRDTCHEQSDDRKVDEPRVRELEWFAPARVRVVDVHAYRPAQDEWNRQTCGGDKSS